MYDHCQQSLNMGITEAEGGGSPLERQHADNENADYYEYVRILGTGTDKLFIQH